MTRSGMIRKTKFKLACCLIAFLLILSAEHLSTAAQIPEEDLPLVASATVNRNSVYIGDKVTYTIEVKASKNTEVKWPAFAENLAGFAIRDFGSSAKGFWGKKTYFHWYVLDTYTSGKYTIPETIIRYRNKGKEQWQKVKTNEVTIEVKSVLQKGENTSDIRDIKGPVGAPISPGLFLFWGVLILLALTGIGVIIYIKKKKKATATPPPQPAHEIAYEELKLLNKKDYIRDGKFKAYYFELSDITRRYLENRFSLKAPEMTTEEFLNRVKYDNAISSDHKNLLKVFLSQSDLVKFAKYQPLQNEIDLSFKSAKTLIDQTKIDTNKPKVPK